VVQVHLGFLLDAPHTTQQVHRWQHAQHAQHVC
jgi:hypothetical protein